MAFVPLGPLIEEYYRTRDAHGSRQQVFARFHEPAASIFTGQGARIMPMGDTEHLRNFYRILNPAAAQFDYDPLAVVPPENLSGKTVGSPTVWDCPVPAFHRWALSFYPDVTPVAEGHVPALDLSADRPAHRDVIPSPATSPHCGFARRCYHPLDVPKETGFRVRQGTSTATELEFFRIPLQPSTLDAPL